MVLVREATTADWQAWRDIRLLALRTAPDAFSSTYAEQGSIAGELRDGLLTLPTSVKKLAGRPHSPYYVLQDIDDGYRTGGDENDEQ